MNANKNFLFLLTVFLSACVSKTPTAPTGPIEIGKGRWESRLKIIDHERGGAVHSVNVDILGEKRGAMRLAYRDWETDRKSTRLNSSHEIPSRMPSSA